MEQHTSKYTRKGVRGAAENIFDNKATSSKPKSVSSGEVVLKAYDIEQDFSI